MKPIRALNNIVQAIEDHAEITDYVVAQEKHEDGSPHLHAYIKLSRKVNIKNPNFFDLMTDEGVEYHGNYQGARSDTAVLKYCVKGAEYISSMSEETIKNKC